MDGMEEELIYLIKRLDEITDKAMSDSKEMFTSTRDAPHAMTLFQHNELTDKAYELSCMVLDICYYTNRLYRLTGCFKEGDAQ